MSASSGNGEDYKQVPNAEKAWEIDAYPLLLAAIRQTVGPRKLISAAVPGLPRDMLAFTRETVPNIMQQVDFLNVMTYDLMNRRDNVTKHHTGLALSIESIDAYVAAGAAPQALNLGLAFYVKWFRTQPNACPHGQSPVGCPTILLEDPQTGEDLGGTGAFSWHDVVPEDVRASFEQALHGGQYDDQGGGHYFWDGEADLWWSFDTPDAIRKKFPMSQQKKLGGVFAWGLGEDAPNFEHLDAVNEELSKLKAFRDEL
jgi:GH18 family chitinase